MRPTEEQEYALELFKTGDSVAIEAGSGTGKTTTLLLLGDSTRRQGQYVAFNKAIVVDAGEKMPRNVSASTAHSLAFRAHGHRFAHRLRSGKRMRSEELAARLGLSPIYVGEKDYTSFLSAKFLASHTMYAVTRFCQSAAEEPTHRHVPYIDGIDLPGRYDMNNTVAKHLEPFMKKAWKDLQSENGSLPYKHDHYLKSWQLSGPVIDSEFILFDEAQDANPVMVAIIAAQKHAQIVWVGDSQQQIYGFTGAINALAGVPSDHRATLSESFRFGDDIAEVANEILDMLDADLRLRGQAHIPSRVTPVAEPDVILCRTNAAALTELMAQQRAGVRGHLLGGARELASFARAADTLINGGRTDHPQLACFASWGEVRSYVEEDSQGEELRLMVGLINSFGPKVVLAALDKMASESEAEIVISTAHKAKGREWRSVQLSNDFPGPESRGDEENRLLYVASTRASLELDIESVTVSHARGPGWAARA